jgi:hypothetical protein
MKNISTGTGLCVAATAALAYPFVSSLAPSANADANSATAGAIAVMTSAQTTPSVVWYGVTTACTFQECGRPHIFRAWSDGRIEATAGYLYDGNSGCFWQRSGSCVSQQWVVVSDPAQGLTYRSDINFDAKVDGADLGMLLGDWGDAPRHDIPPSDCPLNLINP